MPTRTGTKWFLSVQAGCQGQARFASAGTWPHIPPPRCCGAALQHSQHFFHSEACSSPLPSLCSLSKAKTNRSLCAPRASMSGQLWAQLCLWLSGARMSMEHQELAGNQSVHHKPVALASPHSSPGSDRAVASQAATARAVALNEREKKPSRATGPQSPRPAPSLPAHSWEEAPAAASVSWLQEGH